MFRSKSAKQLDAIIELSTTRGTTGGLLKRVDENRELLELLLTEAPEFVEKHRWLVGWIEANDSFFTQLQEILNLRDEHGRQYPRPWPDARQLQTVAISRDDVDVMLQNHEVRAFKAPKSH